MEIWKQLKNNENYQVSSFGRIKSKRGILKPIKKNNGYLQINLCKNGRYKTYILHRLIAETFIPNPNNLPEINHKDENKENNNINNLEWCTKSYNMNYNNLSKRKCKKIYKFSLDNKFLCSYSSITEAANKENICKSGISLCCTNKIKFYKDFIWKYAKQEDKECNIANS